MSTTLELVVFTDRQQSLLERARMVGRRARHNYGDRRQNQKTIQELGELAEACSKLSRALAQEASDYLDGGTPEDVDGERADVLFLSLAGMTDGAWEILERKIAGLDARLNTETVADTAPLIACKVCGAVVPDPNVDGQFCSVTCEKTVFGEF